MTDILLGIKYFLKYPIAIRGLAAIDKNYGEKYSKKGGYGDRLILEISNLYQRNMFREWTINNLLLPMPRSPVVFHSLKFYKSIVRPEDWAPELNLSGPF